jgi:hypothetical protein
LDNKHEEGSSSHTARLSKAENEKGDYGCGVSREETKNQRLSFQGVEDSQGSRQDSNVERMAHDHGQIISESVPKIWNLSQLADKYYSFGILSSGRCRLTNTYGCKAEEDEWNATDMLERENTEKLLLQTKTPTKIQTEPMFGERVTNLGQMN